MRKNLNKGFTLIELIITVSLLSIILVSSYFLINNLLFLKNSNYISYDNQVNRAIIIDTIQQDLLTYGLGYTTAIPIVLPIPTVTNEVLELTLYSPDKRQSKITIKKDGLIYNDFLGRKSQWQYTEDAYSSAKDVSYKMELPIINGSQYALIEIKIPIYTSHTENKPDNNNIEDDIIITYFGKYLQAS